MLAYCGFTFSWSWCESDSFQVQDRNVDIHGEDEVRCMSSALTSKRVSTACRNPGLPAVMGITTAGREPPPALHSSQAHLPGAVALTGSMGCNSAVSLSSHSGPSREGSSPSLRSTWEAQKQQDVWGTDSDTTGILVCLQSLCSSEEGSDLNQLWPLHHYWWRLTLTQAQASRSASGCPRAKSSWPSRLLQGLK